MDFKDSKTQKIAMAVLAFFIIVYFWYSRVYTDLDTQISQKAQEFESITTNLRTVELKAKSLDALKLEYAQLVDTYDEIETLLPEVKQIPSFLVQLHTASSITGTRITKVEPKPTQTEEFYHIASFDIELTGTYHDFGSFISYVANFPFITNVDNMRIETAQVAIGKKSMQNQGGGQQNNLEEIGNKETMTAQFTLSTYYVKEAERLTVLDI
jgi:type IV pilus assembly protein PilO